MDDQLIETDHWKSTQLIIGVVRIFNLGGLKFKKSYPTAETGPENLGGGMQIWIRLSLN